MKKSFSKERVLCSQPAAFPSAVLWAAFGAGWLLFAGFVAVQWVFSDSQFSPIPLTEDDAISVSRLALLRFVEFISLFVACVTIHKFLFEPLMKRQAIQLEGMLVVGAVIAYCWDTTINYYDYLMAWNKHAVNFGTWAAFWPGHTGPVRYAEALFWGPPMYLYFGVGLGGIQWWMINKLESNKYSLLQAVSITFIFVALIDTVAESLIIRTGAYAWPRTIEWLTLWSCEIYQFPLYEAFLVACYATAYALLLRSRDLNGLSFIERGVELLPRYLQTSVRFLAAIGFASLIAGGYFVGFLVISLAADSVIELPAYLQFVD